MIYIYERNSEDSFIIEKAEKLMNKERFEKFKRYKFQREKELCCMSFLLLRYGLKEEYGIKKLPEICVEKYGKPYIHDKSVFFNISHCNNSILCSISKSETGADIQDYCENMLNLKSRILSENEIMAINQQKILENQELTRFWTLKESYGKYYGFGLGYDFSKADFSAIENSDKPQIYNNLTVFSKRFDKYAVSVFSDEILTIKNISSSELYSSIDYFIE